MLDVSSLGKGCYFTCRTAERRIAQAGWTWKGGLQAGGLPANQSCLFSFAVAKMQLLSISYEMGLPMHPVPCCRLLVLPVV